MPSIPFQSYPQGTVAFAWRHDGSIRVKDIRFEEVAENAKTERRKPSEDLLRVGTVWRGFWKHPAKAFQGRTVTYYLYITSRKLGKFAGYSCNNGANRNRAEIEGEIQGENISFMTRDPQTQAVLALSIGKIKDDKILFTHGPVNNFEPDWESFGAVLLRPTTDAH